MTKSDVEHSWDRYCNATGLNINIHQLRHSYATILNKAGVDVKTAQILLGHKDIKITLNIYTEIEKEQLDKARDQINKYI
jgi:site-specific recombinase XerD